MNYLLHKSDSVTKKFPNLPFRILLLLEPLQQQYYSAGQLKVGHYHYLTDS
jgi:hypothetical protein